MANANRHLCCLVVSIRHGWVESQSTALEYRRATAAMQRDRIGSCSKQMGKEQRQAREMATSPLSHAPAGACPKWRVCLMKEGGGGANLSAQVPSGKAVAHCGMPPPRQIA